MEGTRTDDMQPGRKSCWLANDGDEVSVEGLALEGYAKLGWSGLVSFALLLREADLTCLPDTALIRRPGS